MRRLIEKRQQEYEGLAWAFGRTANYTDTQRLARANGLNVRNIKKADAGRHWRREWAVMRIDGPKRKVDDFCDDNENGFREIDKGIGPAPTSIE
jgi:hypothetical protein